MKAFKDITLSDIHSAVAVLEDAICKLLNDFQKEQKIRVRGVYIHHDTYNDHERCGTVVVCSRISNELESESPSHSQMLAKIRLDEKLFNLIRATEESNGIYCESIHTWECDNCWDIESIYITPALDTMITV